MTAMERLRRVRNVLAAATLIQGVLWGVATGVFLLGLNRAFGLAVSVLVPLSFALVVALAVWRNRMVGSRREVALWLEARVPALRYALVTLAEGEVVGAGPALEARIAQTNWRAPISQSLLRATRVPAALLLASALLLITVPSRPESDVAGRSQPSDGETRDGRHDPFRSFVVTIIPPAYSGLPEARLERPEVVSALVGSALAIAGRGWTVEATMPDSAAPLWLEQAGRRHLMLLLPIPDSAPSVQLLSPRRDSVLTAPTGRIALAGQMRDDFGLGEGWFEYIVSSGEGENFTFHSGVVGRRSASGTGRRELSASLRLDSLALAPGNIIHLRAVARDRNNVTGPGVGYSETRTIRIPRPGEGDSIAINQVAPAQGDSSLLSQRMLILLAESLERRRPRLNRDSFTAESRRLAGDQATLRRRVADIIFLRLGGEGSMEENQDSTADALTPEDLLAAAEQATVVSGGEALDFNEDETPVVALNRPLLEAYNAMWAAGRELEIGQPRRALPPMRDALEAIQRARQAERLYLRGRPPVAVVDLARVRLSGELADADPAAALPSAPDQRSREFLLIRFTGAIALLPRPEAVDSLQLLRIDGLDASPRFVQALGEAVAALRRGRDATEALIRARRLLAGEPRATPGLSTWDFAP